MFALVITVIMLVVMAGKNRNVEIGFFAPMVVDLFAWYIVGAYLGVLPAVA